VLKLLLLGLLGTVRAAEFSCPTGAKTDTVWVLGQDSLSLRVVPWRSSDLGLVTGSDGTSGVSEPPGVSVMVTLRAHAPQGVRRKPTLSGVWIRQRGPWEALKLDPTEISWDSLLVSAVAREGPKWPVGSRIDVVTEWTLQGAPGICRRISTTIG
jgi:hypothetical protein